MGSAGDPPDQSPLFFLSLQVVCHAQIRFYPLPPAPVTTDATSGER